MSENYLCPGCGSTEVAVFYKTSQAPVHSVLLLATREEALTYPKGDITLGFCQSCGFIMNVTFDPSLHEYSSNYEGTQAFSSTFNTFHHHLAARLIEKYDLHDKRIIEIGCGQGEFLTLLCELGRNQGIGFDPAYINEYSERRTNGQITIIKDFYSEKYSHYRGDFVCCKMTLEHIQNTSEFVSTVRRSIGDHQDCIVFFQVPNVTYILRDLAFWDIYYEHCSYFSLGSLARLFRKCGFEVIDLMSEYNDQYLMIEAKPGNGRLESLGGKPRLQPLPAEERLGALQRDVAYFAETYPKKLAVWRQFLTEIRQKKRRAVIWGAGSKGVTFLTTLKIQDEIPYAVDVNPRKHNTYMAGTGQQIVAPEFLKAYRPDVVVVMNPVYCDEIRQYLEQLGLTAELKPV